MPAAWLRSAACALNVIPVQSIFKPRFAFRVSRIGKVLAYARCCSWRGAARRLTVPSVLPRSARPRDRIIIGELVAELAWNCVRLHR